MTQPAEVPVAPTVAPTIPTPPPATAPKSLNERVLEELASYLEPPTAAEALDVIGRLRSFQKVNFGDGSSWETGKPIPNNPALVVLAAFNTSFVSEDTSDLDQVPGDCRFYVAPAGSTVDPLDRAFYCYTINRANPTMIAEAMTLETFIREVGREWYNLGVVQGVIEEPDEEE